MIASASTVADSVRDGSEKVLVNVTRLGGPGLVGGDSDVLVGVLGAGGVRSEWGGDHGEEGREELDDG